MVDLMDHTSRRRFIKRGGGLTSSLLSSAQRLLSKIPVGAVVNTAIDALPIEVHLPGGYQYCGPGTKLTQRLSRGDPGINKLDQACKEHDISYSKHSDSAGRTIADRILAERAWERFKSSDANLGERAAALAVATAMKAKTTFGGGCGCRKKRRTKNRKGIKRGGNIKRKKRSSNKKKTNTRKSMWTMVKSGKGLYLKPHRSA